MVTISRRSNKSEIIPVPTTRRLERSRARRDFLKRTKDKVWDEQSEQFVLDDNYSNDSDKANEQE